MTANALLSPCLRDRLKQGPAVGLFWMTLGAPALVELAMTSPPDAFCFDLQHGLWTWDSLEYALAAIADRRPSIVRVAENSGLAIGRALDAGADGVLVPLVETAEEAAAAVAFARFPPEGRRSGGGVRPLAGGFVDYVGRARRETVVGVMIETAAGLANAEAIAATPGLDYVLIGTGDLALSLGTFPNPDPAHEAACRRIAAACAAAGRAATIFTTSAATAAARVGEGYAMVVVANDIDVAVSGFAAAARDFAAALPSAAAALPSAAVSAPTEKRTARRARGGAK